MKAIIESVTFVKEYESKFGTLYNFKVGYNGKTAWYSTKKKDQTAFIKGKEAEFDEEQQETEKGKFLKIKLPKKSFGGYNKAIKKEQSRYSGFAMSYAKDLVVNDKIELKDMSTYAEKMFKLMVKLDKTLES